MEKVTSSIDSCENMAIVFLWLCEGLPQSATQKAVCQAESTWCVWRDAEMDCELAGQQKAAFCPKYEVSD